MPGSPKLDQLAALQARQEAILSGMQDARAEYPTMMGELDNAAAQGSDFGEEIEYPGADELARSASSLDGYDGVTSNEYEYKPEFAGRPEAPRGKQGGPMADELESLPGVVSRRPDGMKAVNGDRLNLHNASAIGELARSDKDKDDRIERLSSRLDALLEGVGEGQSADERLSNARSGRY